MKWHGWIALVVCSVLVLWGISVGAEAVSCDLTARILGEPSRDEPPAFRTARGQTLMNMEGQPSPQVQVFESLVKKEPEWKCAHPLKAAISVGDASLLLVFDSTDLEKEGYNGLVVDLNGNGDLTDDEPIAAKPTWGRLSSSHIMREFPDLKVSVRAGQTAYPHSFQVQAVSYKIRRGEGKDAKELRYTYAQFTSAAVREGELTLDGKPYSLLLVDYNGNGRFDDLGSVSGNILPMDGRVFADEGDRLILNPKEFDRRLPAHGLSHQRGTHPVGPLVCIEGKFYDLEITPAGDRLKLEPANVPLGKVTSDNPAWNVVLYGPQGLLKLTGQAGREIPVPAGEWRLLEYAMLSSWEAAGTGPSYLTAQGTKNCTAVEVKAGQTTALSFGQPFKPTVLAADRRSSQASDKCELEMKLIGAAGEVCTGLVVNGRSPADPSFVIAGANGEKVASGSFSFG